MKKSMKFTILSLAALVLAGCGRTSNTTTAKASDTPTQQTTKAPTTTSKPTEKPSTEKQTTAAPTTADPEEAFAKKWGTAITSLMKAHLDGHVVPYVKLSPSSNGLTSGFDGASSSVFVSGADYDASYVTAAKTAFDDAGWDTSTSTAAIMTAKDVEHDITVVVKNGTDENAGFITLYATYVEPFDPSKGSDWPSDVKQLVASTLHNHFIPYVYLGTVAPVADIPTSTSSTIDLEIVGGNWNDQILTLAGAAFSSDSQNTFAEGSTGWDTSASTSTKFTASCILSDTCRIKVDIYSVSGKAKLEVTYNEAFIEPTDVNERQWSADVEAAITNLCNGKSIPWFYMGCAKDAVTVTTYSAEVDIKGGEWNDAVVDLFKNALAADTADGRAWVLSTDATYTNPRYIAETKDEVGNYFKLKLYQNYSGLIFLEVYFTPAYIVPTDTNEQAWNDTIRQAMIDHLDGNVLPWFYMGKKKDSLSGYWYASSFEYDMTGGNWDDKVVTEFNNAFAADKDNGRNWTKREDTTTSTTSTYYFQETDDANGNHIKVRLSKTYSGYISVAIYFKEAFKIPTGEDAAWSTEIQNEMTTNLGEVLPFVYLGTTNPSHSWNKGGVEYDYYDDWYYFSVPYEKISGSDYDTRIGDNAKTVFADAGWSFEDLSDGKNVNYVFTKKSTTDNSSIEVVLTGSDTTKVVLYIYYNAAYTVPAECTDWSETTKTNMANIGGLNLPYIYLGKKTEGGSWYASTSTLYITGDTWHNQYAMDYQSVLKGLGFTTKLDRTFEGYKLEGEYTNEDGDYWNVKLYPDDTGDAKLSCQYKPSFAVPTDPEQMGWNDDVSTKINQVMHGATLPWIYLGAEKDKVKASVFSNGAEVDITGGLWNKKIVDLAISALEKDNNSDTDTSNDWAWAIDYSSSYYKDGQFFATREFKTTEDGVENTYHISFKLYASGDSAVLWAYCRL